MSELWQRVNVYRLAKRDGEIVLQELWSKAFSDGETEWRDKPTIELPPNNACTRLETGAANSDSESNPAVSSG